MSRWSRLSTLVWSWVLYWLALGAVKLTPAIAAIVEATSAPAGGGSVNASFGDKAVTLEVIKQGATIYQRSIGQLPLALWIGVPPLIFWAVWLVVRRRELAGDAVHVDGDRVR